MMEVDILKNEKQLVIWKSLPFIPVWGVSEKEYVI